MVSSMHDIPRTFFRKIQRTAPISAIGTFKLLILVVVRILATSEVLVNDDSALNLALNRPDRNRARLGQKGAPRVICV